VPLGFRISDFVALKSRKIYREGDSIEMAFKMNKSIPILLMIIACFLVVFSPALAQGAGETLILDFNRDFGYGGFSGDIQGRFSLKVRAPDDIVRVMYYLDDELVYEGTEPPFKWQFNTASYSEGRHTFSAVGYKADGTAVWAEPFTREFLSSDSAWGKTTGMVVPILVIVGIATLGGILGPLLLGRKKAHVHGVYGVAGGAVCPRCTFPFSRSVMAPNLLVGKLERCPHCGKWGILPRASAATLADAEERFSTDIQGTIDEPSEEEKMKQMIEESRFEG
jgi:hypothetical protein